MTAHDGVVGSILAAILRERVAQLEVPRREWREDTYDCGELACVAASLALRAAALCLPPENANRSVLESRAALVYPTYLHYLPGPSASDQRGMLVCACTYLIAEIGRLDRVRPPLRAVLDPISDEAAGGAE